MNGEWLGSRSIRVNWANQKTQTGTGVGSAPSGPPPMSSMPPRSFPPPAAPSFSGMASPMAAPPAFSPPPQLYSTPSYDSASDTNTTVYVGNLIPYTTQADLIPLFQGYGYIVEIRMQADRGFAFVKLDTHQNAQLAITHLQNHMVHGRPIKCSWGKDKEGGGAAPAPVQPAGQYPVVSIRSSARLMEDGIPRIRLLRQLLATTGCSWSTWSSWCRSRSNARWMGLCSGRSVLSTG
jgi:nucleolysin TIA-1/TIAR